MKNLHVAVGAVETVIARTQRRFAVYNRAELRTHGNVGVINVRHNDIQCLASQAEISLNAAQLRSPLFYISADVAVPAGDVKIAAAGVQFDVQTVGAQQSQRTGVRIVLLCFRQTDEHRIANLFNNASQAGFAQVQTARCRGPRVKSSDCQSSKGTVNADVFDGAE